MVKIYIMIGLTLEMVLLVYSVLVLAMFSISRWKFQISFWSSLAISVLFGFIILSILYPMSSLYQVRKKKGLVGLYLFIIIITFIIIVAYVIDKASWDRICCTNGKSTAQNDFYPASEYKPLKTLVSL